MRTFLLLVFYVNFACILSAQNYVDLAKIYYLNTPANDFDSVSGATNVQEYGFDLVLPIKRKSGNVLMTGVSYNNLGINLDPGTSVSLHDLSLKLGMNINHSKNFSGMYIFIPKLASDFNKIGSSDVQFGGVALLKLKRSKQFSYKFGLYYNTEMFGPLFVPLLGCYYTSKNEKLEIDMALPAGASINYEIAKNLRFGFNYYTSTKSFNLNTSYITETNTYEKVYLKKATVDAFLYLSYAIKKNFLFFAKMGYSIGRTFEVYESDDKLDLSIIAFEIGDDQKILNKTFEDGLIYRLGFRYRFIIKDEQE